MAQALWATLPSPLVLRTTHHLTFVDTRLCLAWMQVSEDFFQRRPSSSNSPVRVKIGRSRGPAAPGTKTQAAAARGAAAARKRGRYDLSDSESLSDPEMDGDGSLCDDGTDEASETHVSRRRRSSAGGPASRRSSEVASGSAIPSVSCLGYAYAEMVNGRMHGDATATIKLSGPSQAKKGGPLPPHSRSFYMYPPPSGHYMPHAIPYPMSYGAGAPVAPMYPLHAENSLPPDTTQQV